MKTFKKLILCLTCFIVLLTSLVAPASAVYGEEWLYDDEADFYYVPYSPSYESPTMTLDLGLPNFGLFDPNDINWSEMPTYIQDIVYAPFTPFVNQGDYKIPFVCVAKAATFTRVFAGWNVCLARLGEVSSLSHLTSYYNLFLCCFKSSSESFSNSVLYYADFNLDNELAIPWSAITPTVYGTTGKCLQYDGFNISTSADVDLYLYGGSFAKTGALSVTTDLTSTSNDRYYVANVLQDPNSGFASDTFVRDASDFTAYFSYFSPETIEQQQAATSKGIWQSIKELPSVLMDKIETFFDNFLNYILYFQADKPEHVNPFENLLSGVSDFFDEQMSDVGDFKNSLSSTLANVVDYISSGSGVINSVLTAVPMLSAFVTFFVVFCIVRKVIGR